MGEDRIVVSVPFTLPIEEGAELGEEAGVEASTAQVANVEWHWAQCLSIPRNDVLKLSPKPHKWIRFITGVVLGAEGILCDSNDDDATEILYDEPLSPGSSSLYFHMTPTERARIFPLDPGLADAHAATGTTSSTCFQNFRELIVDRDERCVATGTREGRCDAAHVFGLTKGDDYIEAFTRARSREPPGRDGRRGDYIDDINDPRNGLLLDKTLHAFLAQRDVAFLVTPNFAMFSDDVDPGMQADDPRWTIHDFEAVLHPEEQEWTMVVPHNQPLRVPVDQSLWPPRILFDAIYASAIWKRYGHPDYAAIVSTHWGNRFYPGGITNTRADGGMAEIRCKRLEEEAKKTENERKRKERHARRHNDGTAQMDPLDVLLIATQLSRPPPTTEQRARWATEQKEWEAAKRRELELKVTSWRGICG